MSPRRPRRRARRRSPAGVLIVVAAVVVLFALLVGGLTQVSRQSQGYDADSNRTLAAQGGVVAQQSNATATSVTALMDVIQTQNRPGLQIQLDRAVKQSADEAVRAASAARATPLGLGGHGLRRRLRRPRRRRCASSARPSTATSACSRSRWPARPTPRPPPRRPPREATLLSAAQATNRIAAAGALLARSDTLYRSVRHTLAAAAGHARLPKSVWVRNPQLWQTRHGGDAGRPHGHVPVARRHALPRVAHGAAQPAGPPDAARRIVQRVGHLADVTGLRRRRARQQRHRRRAACHGPLHAGQPGVGRNGEPSRDRRAPVRRSSAGPAHGELPASRPARPTCSRSAWSSRPVRRTRSARRSRTCSRWPLPTCAGPKGLLSTTCTSRP